MPSLLYEVTFADVPGFQADAVLGQTAFEIVLDLRDVRQMRDAVVDLARYVEPEAVDRSRPWTSGSATPPKKPKAAVGRRGILVLDSTQVSFIRVTEEWGRLQRVLHPDISTRLALWTRGEGRGSQGRITPSEEEALLQAVDHCRALYSSAPKRPGEAFFEVLRILLIHWCRKSGPISSKSLAEQAGCTYPTLAEALRRLGPARLRRQSDRRVELATFPAAAWQQLLAQMEKVRAPRAYVDRSGRPRPLDVLLARLRELGRLDVAVGGVAGARHYMPGLDLAGLPRVDLVERAGGDAETDALISRLDPALKLAEPGDAPQVVVHRLFRPAAFFGKRMGEPARWADEVECLLDLHEMGLEAQALEFLEFLKRRPKQEPFGDYEG